MQGGIPPGWYHDGLGIRWWTGETWGAYAPPPGWQDPRSPEAGRTLAIIAHLGCVLGGFVAPLIVYLTQQGRNEFATHHAREALNFQLTVFVAWLATFGIVIGGVIASANGSPPWGAFLVFPALFLVGILNIVLGIVGAVKANNLEWWRYPVCIRFVRGRRS